ncbi:MAG: TonB-dependent receptor [Flavobacterium sp.]|nr:TonB-dependent receptor [Flavobacterium sp.]
MKSYLLLVVLTVNVLISSAQSGSVTGSIVDQNSNPLSGIMVNLQGTDQVYTTDAAGTFQIAAIPYGQYTLTVMPQDGDMTFHPIDIKGSKTSIVITVTKQANQLNEVVVEATTIAKEIEKKGFAVNVIETKEAGLRNLQVNELLDRSVGVRIRQNGGFGSEVVYNINGMSGNSIRIFIDGIPITTYGSSFDLNSIPPSMIERIEIYKGVVPGHLSDDALGGAINIVMKAGAKNNLNFGVSYGSFNTTQMNFNMMYRFKSGFTVRASGFFNNSDNDYKVWGNSVYNILPNGTRQFITARRFNDAFRSIGTNISLGYTDVKWADDFSIGFNGSSMYKEIQHGTFMTTPYKGRFTDSDANLLQLTYKKKNLFTKGLDVSLLGVYGERNRVVNDTVRWNYNWSGELSLDLNGNPIIRPDGAQQGAPTIANIRRKLGSVRTGIDYAISDNHKILVNNIYSFVDREDDDEIRSVLERNFFGTRDLKKSISTFSYELTAFDQDLKVTAFFKNYWQQVERMNPIVASVGGVPTRIEDVVANEKNVNGYGMAISYSLRPKVVLMTSAERGVRLPNEGEIFGDPGDNLTENPTIRPETSYNWNLGFRLGNFKLGNHEIFAAANGFIRDITDRIGPELLTVINSNVQVLPLVNQGNVKSRGFDVELNYSFRDNFRIGLNTSRFTLTTLNRFDREINVANEPTFTITANAQYTFSDLFAKGSRLNLFYNFLFVDNFNYMPQFYSHTSGTEMFNLPEQFVHDAGLSYVFPNRKIIASFDVKNIYNNSAFDNFAVQKPGRAFYLKLNYVLNNL